MQPRQRQTLLQLPSQKQKPRHPSRRKSAPLPRRSRLLAPHPPIPVELPPLPKSSSLPTTRSVSAPTSSRSVAFVFRCPATPTTIGSKPAASSSKKPASSRSTGILPVGRAGILPEISSPLAGQDFVEPLHHFTAPTSTPTGLPRLRTG